MATENQILNARILIVDDQELNTRLISSILAKQGYANIRATTDSTEAYAMYCEYRPDVLILDLNMPDVDGFDVMQQLSSLRDESYLPILVVSTESDKEKRFNALKSGAKDFISKPFDRFELLLRVRNIIEVRLLNNEIRDQNKILEIKVKERTTELYETQLDVIQRLSRAVEYRDLETGMHIVRMSNYSVALAKASDFSKKQCDLILMASPLHDIGKIGIPDRILQKSGKLTAEEWEIMKSHTTIGGELLSGESSEFIKLGREIALTHHEKWDGTGYPNQLKGDNIPMVGRICGLSDVFDALTTVRPYKDAWTVEAALETIENGSGSHFDPALVKKFISILPEILQIKNTYHDSSRE